MLKPLTTDSIKKILANEPSYRVEQLLSSLFSGKYNNFNEITSFPKALRSMIVEKLEWSNLKSFKISSSSDKKTHKAALTLIDSTTLETVLMQNEKQSFTICISSQIGCPLNCSFCGTGKIGFIRNLSDIEIIEQYLFWKKFTSDFFQSKRISNIVLMGMGEPLLNYDNVKSAMNLIIKHTDIGPNYCTLSTAGILSTMNTILKDKEWPNIKIAISLHSADEIIRKRLVPSHTKNFFNNLKKWCIQYTTHLGARTRPLTFEYIMIKNLNDTEDEALKLTFFLKGLKRIKINLIPFNDIRNTEYKPSDKKQILKFQNVLRKNGFITTIRKSEGDRIKAACGQLAGE